MTRSSVSGGSTVSYGSNANSVGDANAGGASTKVSRADHVHSGTTLSYGSNANAVGSANAAGASTLVSRADHVHLGYHTVTASSSNTISPSTLNLRAGTGIAFGVDASSTNQTVTISNIGSGGGGSGSGSDIVQVASGAGSIIIPGLSGSPDIRVAGVNDDEFDTTDASDPMTGWTTFGSPTHDINSTVKSHYYVYHAADANPDMHGIYKTCPSTPFTVTAKVSDATLRANYNHCGLFLAESTVGKLVGVQLSYSSYWGKLEIISYTSRTSTGTAVQAFEAVGVPVYMRIVVTSSTDVAYYFSTGGHVWTLVKSAHNPGFTVAAVALIIGVQNATYPTAATFDWVRFT